MSKAPKTVTAPVTPAAAEPVLSTDELKLLAHREKRAADKRAERQRKAEEKAAAATAPNPTGYVVPPMPAGLRAIRKWLRGAHNAYSERKIGPLELTEVRRSAGSLGDLYRVGADMRKAEAAIRGAAAQEQMAEALLRLEHGGTAFALLARLQDGLNDGKRRPLPPRVLTAVPPPEPA